MSDEEVSRCWIPRTFCRDESVMPDMSSMAQGMDTYNAASRRIASDLGIAYIDLESIVPKDLEHMRDGVHYTRKGSRLIGERLVQAVIDGGFVESKFPVPVP